MQRRRGGTAAKGAGGLGVMGIILIFVLQACLGGGGGSGFNIDPSAFESFDTQSGAVETGNSSGAELSLDDFSEREQEMLAVHSDLIDTWTELFEQAGADFRPAGLQFIDARVQTGCGVAGPEVGPFYCPAPNDENVYLDPNFFDVLAQRFGAAGDFAIAYVQAHEVGHHIQAITGISAQVQQEQARLGTVERNELGVRLELQADCLAGVWGFHVNNRTTIVEGVVLERGDIEEGLRAAAAVGDDSIQSSSGQSINQESWTHGSSEARQEWFLEGFNTGDPNACDTFSVSRADIGL